MIIKKILLTGATGFIGSHLLGALLEEGYEVIITKRKKSDTWRIDKFLPRVAVCGVKNEDLEKVFKNEDIHCIVHLATNYIKSHENYEQAQQMLVDNVVFPSVIAELAVRYGVKKFINTGTFFEYEMKDWPLKETDKILPYNFYAATKVSFSNILRFYCNKNGLDVFNLRLFAPYGEKDNPKLVDFLIKSLGQEGEIDFSGGEQRWNFTYVRDIARAYLLAIKEMKNLKGYENVNIGAEEAQSLKNMVAILKKISGKNLKINWGAKPYVKDEIFYANCENKKAERMLKWKPKYDLEEGLRYTYDYFLKNQ